MFRLIRLKPPHGWNAVGWELVIVTVGVLMALALQQWAENLSSQSRTTRARNAIRKELVDHYINAVEWRTFSPCIAGQLARIESQISTANATLQPIPSRKLSGIAMAVMAPGRIYDNSAWLGAINDGTALQLTDVERKHLTNEQLVTTGLVKVQDEFIDNNERLLAATRPLQLDPGVRLELIHTIDSMRSANERMERSAAEIIFWVADYGAAPTRAEVQADLRRNSAEMHEFCKAEHLPAREVAQAVDPNS